MLRVTMSKAVRALALALVAAALAPACTCSREPKDRAARPAGAEPGKPGAGPSRTGSPLPNVRRAIGTITVDEVKPMLPALDGARVLKEPGKADVGQIVNAVWCYDRGEASEALALVEGALKGAGWPAVNWKPHANQQDKFGLQASKPPYVITGSVQRGAFPGCAGDQGQTYVTLGVYKLETRAGAAPGRPGAPIGPGGVVGAPRPSLVSPRAQGAAPDGGGAAGTPGPAPAP